MTPLQLAAIGIAALDVSAFAWGVWGVFVRDGRPTRGLTVLKAGAAVSAVAVVWALVASPRVQGWNALAGLAMLLGALLLFALSVRVNRARPLSLAYCQDRPLHVQDAGPYRWVRHPFYVSYLLTYAGALLASGNPLLLGVVLGMAAVYVHAARAEERKFLVSPLHAEYAAYQRRTGMFIPRLSRG